MPSPVLRQLAFSLCVAFSLLWAAPVRAQDAPASADAEVAISDEARKHFEVGVRLLEDPDGARYEEAYRAFKKAYAASPSPKILANLGICAMKIERDSEALWAFKEHLAKRKDIDPTLKSQIESDIVTLEGGMATLKLSLEPAGASVEDIRIPVRGSNVINVYGPVKGVLDIGIRAGRHQIQVKLAGYEPQSLEIEADAGQTIDRTITLAKPPGSGTAAPAPTPGAEPEPAPKPTGDEPAGGDDGGSSGGSLVPAFAMVGVTAALAIATGVVGGLALKKGKDFESVNDGSNPTAAQGARDDAKTLNIVTDVLLGVTAASAIVTVVLFVVPPGGSTGEASAWAITPAVGPEGGAMVVTGSF